jgi:ATP-dependent Lon protease
LCAENRKDIEEIKQDYLANMQFHYVTEMEQVIKFALTDEKVNRAIDLQIKDEK